MVADRMVQSLHETIRNIGPGGTGRQQAVIGFALAALLLGLLAQLAQVLLSPSPIDADEAIVGLMAKHILAGQEAPIFYYGQHYFGALEAYLTVPVFALLGVSTTTLRITPLLASLLTTVLVFLLVRQAWDLRRALLAAALSALPPWFYFEFTLRARGGFPESFALMLLLALICLRWKGGGQRSATRIWALGLLSGFLLYVYQAALLHTAALVAAALLIRDGPRPRAFLHWTGGVLLGAMPLIVYNWIHPLATVAQAAGQKYLGMAVQDYHQEGLVQAVLSGTYDSR